MFQAIPVYQRYPPGFKMSFNAGVQFWIIINICRSFQHPACLQFQVNPALQEQRAAYKYPFGNNDGAAPLLCTVIDNHLDFLSIECFTIAQGAMFSNVIAGSVCIACLGNTPVKQDTT